jgi:mono/diheme cytochrome c family protein
MEEKNNIETEIKFLSLLKSPSRLFGMIFPYYAVLFLIVGIYFVKHMDSASFNEVQAIYTDSLEINANVEVKKGGIMPAIDMGIISTPTNELVEKGKDLFTTNCVSCHGTEGKGDGVAAVALNPAPRNFLNNEGWTKGTDFPSMYTTIQKGIIGTGMIGYDFLPIEDRIALIHYIRTMAEYPAVTEAHVAELDKTYNLSEGINAPNNITLEMAQKKISKENSEIMSEFESVISKINSVEDKNAIELFNQFVQDKGKVISIFKRDFASQKNAESFVNRVLASPTESGFKSSITFLSKEKLSSLFKLLSNSVS